jgi:hypothetical protein
MAKWTTRTLINTGYKPKWSRRLSSSFFSYKTTDMLLVVWSGKSLVVDRGKRTWCFLAVNQFVMMTVVSLQRWPRPWLCSFSQKYRCLRMHFPLLGNKGKFLLACLHCEYIQLDIILKDTKTVYVNVREYRRGNQKWTTWSLCCNNTMVSNSRANSNSKYYWH